MRHTVRAIVLSLAATLASTGVHSADAQPPTGSDTLSAAAVAESLSVLRELDRVVRGNRNDAATWHRIGMIAWALYERDRHPPSVGGLDWTLLGRQADTALRIAALIEPQNGLYSMTAGRFLLNSGISITRAGSYGFFTRAIEAAREGGNPHVIAETAIEAGRVFWRRYDSFASRWMPIDGAPSCLGAETFAALLPSGSGRGAALTPQGARIVRTELEAGAMELGGSSFPGEADYLRSEELFREAFDVHPSFERAFRQLAMLLVERGRWMELTSVARRRVDSAPWDAWAWMTLGLALHRQEARSHLVAGAFDSAFAYLPVEERRRLDRLERILRPTDSVVVRAMDEADKAAMNRYYWLSADPLWSQEGSEPRLEFLARVTYAELRWTVEEMKVRGADTDRGDIHIRYGPPDLVLAFGPRPSSAEICTIWAYNLGMKFYFTGAPTFATARIPFDDREMVAAIVEDIPARWDNIAKVRIAPMLAQVARFRGGRDSVDLFVAVEVPVEAIRRSSDVDSPVRADFWILEGGTHVVARDSVNPAGAGPRIFTRRVHVGWYVYRAEATADGALLGASSSARVFAYDTAGFTSRGFGMSDVIVATRARATSESPRTWRDLEITPQLGSVPEQASVALVWENYGLASENGTARYTLTLTVERQRSAVGRIAAQVLSGAARAAGIDRSEDRLTMRFEREAASAEAIVENLTLALADTPAGTYTLTIEVTDAVGGGTASRTMTLTVGG